MKTEMKVGLGWLLVLFFALTPNVLAQENADGVAGCQSIAVDPAASFEVQQAICGAAEQNASSSCSAGGHGMCSSPKKDGTLMEGTNCICLHEEEAVVAE